MFDKLFGTRGSQNGELVALTLLAAAETAHSFSSYLPSYFTIKSFALSGDQEEVHRKVSDLRSGYVPASIFGIALGAVVSMRAKSPLPFLATIASAGVMIALYEGALPQDMRLCSLGIGVQPRILPGCKRPCVECPAYQVCEKRKLYWPVSSGGNYVLTTG